MNLRFYPLVIALFTGPGAVYAISVELVMTSPDYCISGPHIYTGELEAVVSGGTGPFTYDWYDSTDGMVQLCADCGPVRGGLEGIFRLYTVVVTDGLGATAEAQGGVQGLVGAQADEGFTLAYEPGTSPVLIVDISNDLPDAWDNAPEVTVVPEPLFTYGPWPGTNSLYKAVLPVGTSSVQLTAVVQTPSGPCTYERTIAIAPATVLPDMEVVELEGSCTNAGTGSATVQFSNGLISSELSLVLKTVDGFQVSFNGQYSVGDLPYLQTLSGILPGSYWLVMTGDFLVSQTLIPGFSYTCRDSIAFSIPDLGPTCGVVAGTVFLDNNLNCTKQTNEPGIPNTILEVLPGPYYTSTNAGAYSLVLPNGSYTVRELSTVVDEHCTDAPIPFTITGAATPVTVNHPTVSLVPLDVEITLGSGVARPGFEFAYAINVTNRTVSNTGTVTVIMQLDPVLGYLGAIPTPTSVSGGTLSWTFTAMPTFQERNITIRTQVPPDVALLGTDLISTATVSTALADAEPANNSSTNTRTVTGSYDPNDKLAYASGGSTTHYDPALDQWIEYTIRFQNTGTDTAFHILITDTLAANLDPASINIGAASHAFTWELRGAGILKFRFYNILLPDSTINEPRSHGFVSFRIRPRLPLAPGAVITNEANIYFDFNPPVITPPSVLQVPLPDVLVNAKVLLGGVAGAGTGSMSDALRTQALLPTVEPYTALGYAHVNAVGNGTVLPAVFTATGANAIVDWVVVELRNATAPFARVASRSALLQRDGDVVDRDGISAVSFSVPIGNYRVAVRHRNHLGVMTNSAYALSATPTVIDLTVAGTPVFGTNARTNVNGRLCLWPGDVNFDGIARYTGAFNDRDPILTAVGGSVPTNVLTSVYNTRDVNLDGNVRYTGTNNDRDFILTTVGGTVPTAVRTQQLP